MTSAVGRGGDSSHKGLIHSRHFIKERKDYIYIYKKKKAVCSS